LLADDAVSCEPVSATKSPANREINREFRKIRPSTAIFVSDQRANSRAYSRIPYATEQGIFKRVSGNVFRGTGNFNRGSSETGAETSNTVRRRKQTSVLFTAQIGCPLSGVKRIRLHDDAASAPDPKRTKAGLKSRSAAASPRAKGGRKTLLDDVVGGRISQLRFICSAPGDLARCFGAKRTFKDAGHQ
jgi:hypothetical protein